MLKKEIHSLVVELEQSFELIPPKRRTKLEEISTAIKTQLEKKEEVNVCIICTHNSRRSQVGQLWLSVAAMYYGVKPLFSYSGGTESTSFNYRMVNALLSYGFEFKLISAGSNPNYKVNFCDNYNSNLEQVYFSKTYTDRLNPQDNFIAVLVCDNADKECPIVIGASHRIYLPYIDPKESDDTSEESKVYRQKIREIGREFLYFVSLLVEPKS